MTPLEDAENRLILQVHRVAEAQRRLTKALAVGWVDSEIRGASLDLIHAGNEVERIRQTLQTRQALAPKDNPPSPLRDNTEEV